MGHGAPIVTADLDIILDAEPENIQRLVAALAELGAVYRDPLGRRIEPTAEALASTSGGGHHLFVTTSGDLDVLRSSAGHDYSRSPLLGMSFVGAIRLRRADGVGSAHRPPTMQGLEKVGALVRSGVNQGLQVGAIHQHHREALLAV